MAPGPLDVGELFGNVLTWIYDGSKKYTLTQLDIQRAMQARLK